MPLRKRLRNLPDPVAGSDRFLLWRNEWNEKRKKFLKTPYYVNGRKRSGGLDSKRDLSRLASLDEALDAYEIAKAEGNPYDGVGLAVVGGEGIGAFDMDKCLTDDGEMMPTHAGRYVVERAEKEGAYIEISPSGRGLRILGPCDDETAYSKGGLEYWGSGRYVTLTGSLWANPRGWKDLSRLRATLPSSRSEENSKDWNQEDVLVTRKLLEELRSALEAMDSDERDLWIRMGHSLKTLGDKGKELWMEWSQKSEKYEEHDAEYTWSSLRPNHTSYRSVFSEAQENWGWENPRGGKKSRDDRDGSGRDEGSDDPDDGGEGDSLLDFSVDLGRPKLHPTEFVIDGFLPVGVSLVAGGWGAGKTTNLIPVFASVAHIAPEEWGLRPQIRRHVVWVTEAPDQSRDVIYSLYKTHLEEVGVGWDEVREWFHIVPAYREGPKTLASLVRNTVETLTYTQDNGFAVRPVVVLDTVSANVDLENESDNSEVGWAMARLKEALPGVPLVLVGHTSKTALHTNAGLSFRGAGAWEADAGATFFLVHEEDIGVRYLAIGKARFSPDFSEISFGEAGGRELVQTEWGPPQSKSYVHGVPQKSNGEERAALRREAKEAAKGGSQTSRQDEVLAAVTGLVEAGTPPTKTSIYERTGGNGKRELFDGAVDELVKSGAVLEIEPDEKLPFPYHKTRKFYVPDGTDLDVFLSEVRARTNLN